MSRAWTQERRERASAVQKATWARKKAAAVPVGRRIAVRNTVHIFQECLATLDLLRARFESLSRLLRSMDEHAYANVSAQALVDAEVVQRAIDALQEVVVLKRAIELPEAVPAVDPQAGASSE